ncbi:lysylphosphatidylglycerol synthase transmembrane domain-containing protein [Chondromyces apiculatus]|uniref:Uncharacterized protein n=1 Tax=Chondromyces apiculatus DSM 436 TaxID=1192034 RepID=A0A017SYU4_9BACT|nr:lysylphosphatidylglycerol synthase transmembrane domain-containing protein [Chondromyces apiculatus]EYF02108.1 Hypothetical protein CAP_7448 [Chondromyces apiculatus DSM 436]
MSDAPDPGSLGGTRPDAAPPPARSSLLKRALRWLGPIILVIVILRIPDRGEMLRALAAAAPLPILFAVLLNAANVYLKVVRWQALLRTRGIRYPTGRAFSAFLSSVYVGMLTPGRVGDVLRIQYLRHDLGVSYAEGLASIVMDRLCDLYVLAAFVAFGVVRYSPVIVGELAYVTWGGVAAIVIAPVFLLVPGLAEKLLRGIYDRLTRGKAEGGLDRFLVAVRANIGRPLLVTIPLTTLAFVVNYVQGWIIGQAMGIDLGLTDATCLLAIASLLGLLPISVSGVGVRELFFSLVFPLLGRSPGAGVSFGLLVFAVIYVVNIAAGFVSWQLAPPPTGSDSDAPQRLA